MCATSRIMRRAATRDRLLEAGLTVAMRDGLSQMSVDSVTTEAGVAKGTYYVHFPSRDAFLVALYEQWHGTMITAVLTVIEGLPHGGDRLRRGVEVYLDAVLDHREVRALLVSARADPAVKAVAQLGMAMVIKSAEPDFEALGHAYPSLVARLCLAAVAEAAMIEAESGHAVPEVRYSLASVISFSVISDPEVRQ